MNARAASPLIGTTAECAEHYAQRFDSRAKAEEQYLTRFPQTERGTIQRWFRKGKMPESLRLVQLQIFLAEQGYSIPGIAELPQCLQIIRRHYAEGHVTGEDLAIQAGYTTAGHLRTVLFGKHPPGKMQLEKFIKIAARLEPVVNEPPQPEPVSEPTSSDDLHARKDETIGLLAAHIKAILPLAQAVASDLFSAEDRERLREEVGEFPMFHATNALIGLSGERARQNVRSKSKGKSS